MSIEQITATPQNSPLSVSVLGVRVDRISQAQTLEQIEALLARYRAAGGAIACKQLVTVNTEFIMAAQRDEAFRAIINHAALVVPDGMGVVWATRYLGRPAPERVTGTDTLVELAGLCARHSYRLYLLGAAPGVAEEAGRRLQERYPALEIAGSYAGSPAIEEEEGILERLRAANADVLCVAYGAPAQERWIARNLERLPVAVAMGVGGAYDFLSGRQRRAPRAMQRLGVEWLYRLYREPWRWRRMLALPRFAIVVILKGRGRQHA